MKFNKNTLLIVLAILVLTLAACDNSNDSPDDLDANNEPQAEVTTITISGSGSASTVLRGLESDFEIDNPSYDLDVLAGSGTGGGVKGVTDGLLDVAAMARSPHDTELEVAPSFVFVPIGQAGIGLMVHPTVTIESLTSEEVSGIFSGEITNWLMVGGSDADINLFVRDEQEPATGSLRDTFFGDTAFLETAITITSAADMMTSIEGTEYSIGYGVWPAVVTAGVEINALQLDGVSPTDASYPMVTPLGIGYLAEKQDLVQDLVDWLGSDTGKTTLRNLGVILE